MITPHYLGLKLLWNVTFNPILRLIQSGYTLVLYRNKLRTVDFYDLSASTDLYPFSLYHYFVRKNSTTFITKRKNNRFVNILFILNHLI